MGRVNLPYLHSFTDRHKTKRHYYRRGGLRQRIEGQPGTPEFTAAYQRIHDSFESPGKISDVPGTFGHLLTSYYAASEFTQLRPATKSEYGRHLEAMRAMWGPLKAAAITRRVVKAFRDTMADRPASANSALRVLKTLMGWGVDSCIIAENTAKGVKALKTDSDGWAPWPADALTRFATKSQGAARTAFYLALHTGQRRGDVLGMCWDDIKDGGIAVKQEKTGAALWIPIHPTLAAELEILKVGRAAVNAERAREGKPPINGNTIVQRVNGQPYTGTGFGSIWNREQHRLKMPGLPFHGLRKCATQALFEAGCTPQEVQAITGHATLQMVEHYGRGANQKRMAGSAMRKMTDGESV